MLVLARPKECGLHYHDEPMILIQNQAAYIREGGGGVEKNALRLKGAGMQNAHYSRRDIVVVARLQLPRSRPEPEPDFERHCLAS